MAATTNRAGQLNTRSHGGIIRVGSVIASGPMAILALDSSELRGCACANEAGGQAISYSVAREALRILILLLVYQRGESLGVKSKKHAVVSRLMTFGAVLGSDVLRTGPLDLEHGVALGDSYSGSPAKIGWTADSLPLRRVQTFLE